MAHRAGMELIFGTARAGGRVGTRGPIGPTWRRRLFFVKTDVNVRFKYRKLRLPKFTP
jgi:hypothetical protein